MSSRNAGVRSELLVRFLVHSATSNGQQKPRWELILVKLTFFCAGWLEEIWSLDHQERCLWPFEITSSPNGFFQFSP